jgi:uncharacterized membrane protein YfcA
MLVSGCKMVCGVKGDTQQKQDVKYFLVLLNGIIVGILSGLVGAGGGFLIVPALVFFMSLPMHKAIGTSLLIISINSLIGFTGDVLNLPKINWEFLLIFSSIASAGVILGIYLNQFLNSDKLKKIFGYFVLVMAVVIIFKELL